MTYVIKKIIINDIMIVITITMPIPMMKIMIIMVGAQRKKRDPREFPFISWYLVLKFDICLWYFLEKFGQRVCHLEKK